MMQKGLPVRWIEGESGPIPGWMNDYAHCGKENIEFADIVWPGAYAEITESQRREFERWLADPTRILRSLLRALVRGHSNLNVESRLQDAFCAITGRPKPVGNKCNGDDEEILLEMGRIYVKRAFGFEDGPLIVGDIAIAAQKKISSNRPLARHSEDSSKRRLRRKFTGDIDRWCYAGKEWLDSYYRIIEVDLSKTTAALGRLGILIDPR